MSKAQKIIKDDLRLIRTAKFYKNKFSEIIPSKREMTAQPTNPVGKLYGC